MPEESPPIEVSRGDARDRDAIAALQSALGPDFDIKRKLGRGSVATVFLAREKALDRPVAVKVLHPGKAGDETARRRFEREARAAASLMHPNVVQVFRFGRLPDQTPFLVMRFVKGRTMEERLQAEGRLPADLAKQVLADVAGALAAAHAQGIVHRDVRPANVLWDEEGRTALLADFGIAALLTTGGEDVTRLTKTGQLIGDPRYLSPEQLLDRDLTELSDMYAFGVMGYELLTGTGPYDAKSNTQWITAHLNAEPADLRALRPDVEPAVGDLLKRCLNREPNHRPSASDASRVLAGEILPPVSMTSGSVEEVADLQALIKRRVPQIVLIAGAAGWALMTFIDQLADRGVVPDIAYRLTLPFVASAVAAATVVAWFHGERGKQQANVLEWILLSVIGVIWLTVTTWIVVGSL